MKNCPHFSRTIAYPHLFVDDPETITGLPSELVSSEDFHLEEQVDSHNLFLGHRFLPGSIVAFKGKMFLNQVESFERLQKLLSQPHLDDIKKRLLSSNIDLIDLNYLLFRCGNEEDKSYNIPQYGDLCYNGLAGVVGVMRLIQRNNDLGHPFCQHLRSGNWLMDFTTARLTENKKLEEIRSFLSECFGCVKQLPRYLVPRYFILTVDAIYSYLVKPLVVSRMSKFVKSSSLEFVRDLSMGMEFSRKILTVLGSLQMFGYIKDSPLMYDKDIPSVAAGLPHFSRGFMRCWGRDTFISLRGLFLVTGRYKEAKDIILGFATTLRHGQIPNLLDSGRNPRFNARDATWWFLQAVQDYCKFLGNVDILSEIVERKFPYDDQYSNEKWKNILVKQTLSQIIMEIMQKHYRGIHYREWNAGNQIDSNMSDEGFNVGVAMDATTGMELLE